MVLTSEIGTEARVQTTTKHKLNGAVSRGTTMVYGALISLTPEHTRNSGMATIAEGTDTNVRAMVSRVPCLGNCTAVTVHLVKAVTTAVLMFVIIVHTTAPNS